MNNIEKNTLIVFFNDGGYVLDFSNSSFDDFAYNSVGIRILEKYKMSKGKSLEQFVYKENDTVVFKFLGDLMDYYENVYLAYNKPKNEILYNRCKEILAKEREKTIISLEAIDSIDHDYIKKKILEANDDLKNGRNDSAITKARTILEESFCFAIEKKGIVPSDKGNINNLYKQVKELYKMNEGKNIDVRVNTLLSGLNKIVEAIAEMRNEYSDSHGIGTRRIDVDSHTAKLAVGSAIAVSEYIIDISKRR